MKARRNRTTHSLKRGLVTLLALVMVLSVCFPGLSARATEDTGDVTNIVGEDTDSIDTNVEQTSLTPDDAGAGNDVQTESETDNEPVADLGSESDTETGTEAEAEAGSGNDAEVDNEAETGDGAVTDSSEGANVQDPAVTQLFNRLMSAKSYEELDEMMRSMTSDEYGLLNQFSDEQNSSLKALVVELEENTADELKGKPSMSTDASAICDEVFYWRFKNSQSGNTAADALSSHVHVTYLDLDDDTAGSKLTVPKGTVTSNGVVTLASGSATVYCGDVIGNGSNATSNDLRDGYVYVTTDAGYVITSYVIGCEFDSQYGENCQTAATNNLEVELDVTGLYQSNLTIHVDPKDDSELSFNHGSNSGHTNHHYVLLLTIAEVNVNLTVDKSANKESVNAGETITYTAVANTTNDLTNVKITDSFFSSTNTTITSVKLVNKTTNESEGLTSVSSMTNFDYTSNPSQYYHSGSSLYLNGKWTSNYQIVVTYTYKTSENITNTTTLTNQVVVIGTKTGTDQTVEDMGIANVNVIVNSATKGSIRVYKTFSGLTTAEVVEALKTFSVAIDGDSMGTPTFYSSQTTTQPYTYTYYWSKIDLQSRTYTVTESGYDVSGYLCSSSYSVKFDGEDVSASGTYPISGISTTVEAKKTSIVYLTNSYINKEPAVQFVKVWKDSNGNVITGEALKELGPVAFTLKDGTTEIGTYTVNNDNNWTSSVVILDEAYYGKTLTVTESIIEGYSLESLESEISATPYSVTTEVWDEDGETHTEVKTYQLTVYTATNKPSVASVTISKEVTGNLGDVNKKFTFTATLADASGNTLTFPAPEEGENYTVADNVATFSLADGESITIDDLSIGSVLTVTEKGADSYLVKVNDVTKKSKDVVGDVTVTTTVSADENDNLAFENNNDAIIDTGITTISYPFILLLSTAIVGAFVLLLCKRRQMEF